MALFIELASNSILQLQLDYVDLIYSEVTECTHMYVNHNQLLFLIVILFFN